MICNRCQQPIPKPEGSIGTGYGKRSDTGETICYECCALDDREAMLRTGRATLYLVTQPADRLRTYKITNWPGTLTFIPGRVWKRPHNLGGTALYVRFIGPDGDVWSGKHVGDFNDVVYCRRTKLTSVLS